MSSYAYIYEQCLSGNHDHKDLLLLHEKAWELVKDHFRKKRENLKIKFQDFSAGEKTSSDIEEIVQASHDGRVQALFIQKGKNLYGVYDANQREVQVHNLSTRTTNTSWFNLAAVTTLLTGGDVFLNHQEKMPAMDTEVNALLRY
ncbi:MAG: hypothetical protein MUO54_16100 [Anaerolineales bacterium]|nr:hypothetical protein [Anaerolineales bacterium]